MQTAAAAIPTAPPLTLSDRIMAARAVLPSHALAGAPSRRWVAAVCQAEVDHADRDFWRVVHGMGVSLMFDRYGDPMCAARHRFDHEEKAGRALNMLSHLQSEESIIRDRLPGGFHASCRRSDRPWLLKMLAIRRRTRAKLVKASADYMQAREAVDKGNTGKREAA